MAAVFTFQAYVYANGGEPLGLSLDEAAEQMSHLPGLVFEWDGSFSWTNQGERWQISGTVYDNGQQVIYVDLHGRAETVAACQSFGDRLADLFRIWGSLQNLAILRLPERQWQDLQTFETEVREKATD